MSATPTIYRCDVMSASQLAELASAPLPLGIRAADARREMHRDIYLDTSDDALRRLGLECRLRIGADDRHWLSLYARMEQPSSIALPTLHASVRATSATEVVLEENAVTRRLRGIVDPTALEGRVALEVERWLRTAHPDWLRRPRLELHLDRVTVRRDGTAREFHQLCVHSLRGEPAIAERLVRALERQHGVRPLGVDRRDRAELLLKWMHAPAAGRSLSGTLHTGADETNLGEPDLLDPELSLLAFQERVLTLAEDPETPLAERLRFLAIVAANVDEFFTVRVAGLRTASIEPVEENEGRGVASARQLHAISARVAELTARQRRCLANCLPALDAVGVRIRRWQELDEAQRTALRARFESEILPALTPLAMTMSPGHPAPRMSHLSLSLATILVDGQGGPPRFAETEVPDLLPRFLRASGDSEAPGSRDLVPLEEVIRANLALLYPRSRVDQAFFFRVTRAGDLLIDEAAADDLLEAVDAATRQRARNAVVRIEVEREMPTMLRDLVLDTLRGDPGAEEFGLALDDVFEADAPLDLTAVGSIALPKRPELHYPNFTPALPIPEGRSIFEELRERDLLVHHPFESFRDTVVRFIAEAASDPDVTTIKITLYRVGDHSPIVAALRDAARMGKQVVAFVELRARFDEERNVAWVRALETAGVHVVYGLVGVKTHAKAALVVRREEGQLRRYAHVGTGNYNARTGLAYTDLSLLSADEALASDLGELFNTLTGTSAPPVGLTRGSLVAPLQMRQVLLRHIEREAAHARAGRPAQIRIKVNGLSDADIVRALGHAADDGVQVDLLVRGICTLRPRPPRLRVVTHVGRLLEHSRIYHFANGGDPLYYIGSADLRPRNLRRRVELLVPVAEPEARLRLDRLLELYLADPTAWELAPNGDYHRRPGGPSAQDILLAELTKEG